MIFTELQNNISRQQEGWNGPTPACITIGWYDGPISSFYKKGNTPPVNSLYLLSYSEALHNDEQRIRNYGSYTHLGFEFDEYSK